jgi:hypothetical protein
MPVEVPVVGVVVSTTPAAPYVDELVLLRLL